MKALTPTHGVVAAAMATIGLVTVTSAAVEPSLEMVARVYRALLDLGADRGTAVVALGGGVVIECSRMDAVLELEPRERWARVQPGVVYTTFHNPETGANVVTTEYGDWATDCPEYKVTAVQIALGVTVIWFGVPLILALSHQAVALFMFVVTIFINYRLAHEPVPYPGELEPQMELTAV